MSVQLPIRPQAEIEWQLLNLLYLRGAVPIQEAYRTLADRFELSTEERNAVIGQDKRESAWKNECRFAKRRLDDQGYVISQSRGMWAITPKGAEVARDRGPTYQSSICTAEELGL